jgi:hypothetical protein
MKRLLFFCILIFLSAFLCLSVYAQKKSDAVNKKEDSIYMKRENYVLSARTKLTIFVFANRYLNGNLFTNPGINSYYFPIAPLNIGLGFSHKWLAVNVAILSPRIGKNNYNGEGAKYHNFNLQLLAYTHKYGLDVIYSRNTGYFLGNYNNYVNVTDVPDKTPYFDMSTQRLTVNLLRIFNPIKYSMNATMIGGEMQKNNASSFIFNTSFSMSRFNMGDSIPSFVAAQANPDLIFKSGTFYSVGLLPGYGFTWIINKRFYFGIIPAFGPSLQYKSMNFETQHEERFAISYRVLAKAGLGFHAKKWTAGLSVLFDSERYHLGSKSNIINNNGKVTMRVGYKINVPKWGKRISKKMTNVQNSVEHTLNNF